MAAGTAVYPNPPYFRNGRDVKVRPFHQHLSELSFRFQSRRDQAFGRHERERLNRICTRVWELTPNHFAYSNRSERNWTEYLVADARIRYEVVKAECGVL